MLEVIKANMGALEFTKFTFASNWTILHIVLSLALIYSYRFKVKKKILALF